MHSHAYLMHVNEMCQRIASHAADMSISIPPNVCKTSKILDFNYSKSIRDTGPT